MFYSGPYIAEQKLARLPPVRNEDLYEDLYDLYDLYEDLYEESCAELCQTRDDCQAWSFHIQYERWQRSL